MGELIYAGLLMMLACLIMAYVNANSTIWSAGLLLSMVLISVVVRVTLPVLLICWLLVGFAVVVLKNDKFRKTVLIKPAFA